MAQRSLLTVLLLSVFTFGIYLIVWFVKTKREMVERGADIPTAILLILPIVSIYWTWKYCGGVEHVTGGRVSQIVAFLLLFFLGVIGVMILQDAFNKAVSAQAQSLPRAYVA